MGKVSLFFEWGFNWQLNYPYCDLDGAEVQSCNLKDIFLFTGKISKTFTIDYQFHKNYIGLDITEAQELLGRYGTISFISY